VQNETIDFRSHKRHFNESELPSPNKAIFEAKSDKNEPCRCESGAFSFSKEIQR